MGTSKYNFLNEFIFICIYNRFSLLFENDNGCTTASDVGSSDDVQVQHRAAAANGEATTKAADGRDRH